MEQQHTEEFKVSGDEVLKKVKEIITAGNARRILIKDEKGETDFEIPLTFAVAGAVLLPLFAALGAAAALLTKCTIVVVRKESKKDAAEDQSQHE